LTNLTGVYSPTVIYDVNGTKYKSVGASSITISNISHIVGKYVLQTQTYTAAEIGVKATTPTFYSNESCVFPNWEVAGSNVSDARPDTYCCIGVDTLDDGLAGVDKLYAIGYYSTSGRTYRVWTATERRDDLAITGSYSIAGSTGLISWMSLSSCPGHPFVDCMHNASSIYPAMLPLQLFQNGTSGQVWTAGVNLDGKYMEAVDWATYYTSTYAHTKSLRQRLIEGVCSDTVVACNATTCTYRYGLGDPARDATALNLTSVIAGAVLNNNTGFVVLPANFDYSVSITYQDILVRLEPAITWVSVSVECSTLETTLSYVNHGEAGELVVAVYYVDSSSAIKSLVVVAGIGSVVVDSDAILKVCTDGTNCIKVIDRCALGAVDPASGTESSALFDSQDKTQYGFVVSTIVLGGILVLGIASFLTWKLMSKIRSKYSRLPTSSTKMKTKGGFMNKSKA
jgi:hypothetical protein